MLAGVWQTPTKYAAFKWVITEKVSDYLILNKLTVYGDNNPLTCVLNNAKLEATGQRWVSALGIYNFESICKHGKTI